MTIISLDLQLVNGDPATTGNNINITTSTVSAAFADEVGPVSLSSVAAGDSITVSGLVYSYEYLGSHDVRNDPAQPAAYIRIIGPLPAGATLSIGTTYAIDLTGQPGDPDYPNLQNGNTKGKVAALDTTSSVQFPGVVCFASGTQILTSQGYVRVENLAVGDTIVTRDHGLRPLQRILSRHIEFCPQTARHKPIEFKAGSLGDSLPRATLCVSPQHRILVNVNGAETLVAAKGLIERKGVRVKKGCRAVDYYHLVFDQHEIIYSEGLATESFYPGHVALSALDASVAAEIEQIFDVQAPEDPLLKILPARDFLGVSRAQRMMRSGGSMQEIGLRPS